MTARSTAQIDTSLVPCCRCSGTLILTVIIQGYVDVDGVAGTGRTAGITCTLLLVLLVHACLSWHCLHVPHCSQHYVNVVADCQTWLEQSDAVMLGGVTSKLRALFTFSCQSPAGPLCATRHWLFEPSTCVNVTELDSHQ